MLKCGCKIHVRVGKIPNNFFISKTNSFVTLLGVIYVCNISYAKLLVVIDIIYLNKYLSVLVEINTLLSVLL